MAGIGLILGLEQTPDLPPQTLMSLDPTFLNDTINPVDPLPSLIDPLTAQPPQSALRDLEPVFPGNFDILHGNYVHRSDSIDVDLYRFEVNLGDADRVGTLTAETFAERLSDSSLLDTTLTLFQEKQASVIDRLWCRYRIGSLDRLGVERPRGQQLAHRCHPDRSQRQRQQRCGSRVLSIRPVHRSKTES